MAEEAASRVLELVCITLYHQANSAWGSSWQGVLRVAPLEGCDCSEPLDLLICTVSE